MSRLVEIIPASQLEAWTTAKLLSRLQSLRSCEESYECSEKAYHSEPPETGVIEYKDTEEWKTAYYALKQLLTDREHLPRPAEKKSKRLSTAALRKQSERRSGRRSLRGGR